MPPHEGLVHPKEYDIKDSNVELIGTGIDHNVKYNSAATEPAWNDGKVGQEAGLYIWRIEAFEVIPWPKDKYGQFHEGDSYIVLHSYKIGSKDGEEKLGHDIFFWLGSKTTQDEAGTAAYKTVELDEFLHGVAVQHREIQQAPSDDFVALFPRLSILKGGVRTGFTHVDTTERDKPREAFTLLRIFKHPAAGRDSIMVHEVEPTWQSLDQDDVFVLDHGDKIWVWQGKSCSPIEKLKAAQVVHDLTLAKHIDTEVLAQGESRSRLVVDLLGGKDVDVPELRAPRPITSTRANEKTGDGRPRKLFRLSDASGELSFDLIKDGQPIQRDDLDGKDVFLLDTGRGVWVWIGRDASKTEREAWIKVAQAYLKRLQEGPGSEEIYLTPISKVVQGSENASFWKALEG